MNVPKYKEHPCHKNTNYYCKCGHCYTLYGVNKRKMKFCYNCGRPINTVKLHNLRTMMNETKSELLAKKCSK